jgi:hypothetical protein
MRRIAGALRPWRKKFQQTRVKAVEKGRNAAVLSQCGMLFPLMRDAAKAVL